MRSNEIDERRNSHSIEEIPNYKNRYGFYFKEKNKKSNYKYDLTQLITFLC